MLLIRQILGRVFVLGACTVTVAGCGQAGALYLPTSPAAANRATLPESLLPDALSPGPVDKTSAPIKR
ncbi:MAG: hypothetical protein AUJ20_11100 [Comamonadaceae bacterium CG1_02_60_18]|nr:MAG: hypothetical protein AUJ20_11100 [Comamonadaceae bacterium CG1_02_60_18]PIQ52872.1 MAG: hypothetical protein COW02_08870 [Comamonadaceae bacterium CG12_big_fil_rev_8_21_14_0_65_59_15]